MTESSTCCMPRPESSDLATSQVPGTRRSSVRGSTGCVGRPASTRSPGPAGAPGRPGVGFATSVRMTRLKIALACDWYAPQIGGIENYIADLAKHLRERGHDAHVVTSIPGASEIDGVPVHRLGVIT